MFPLNSPYVFIDLLPFCSLLKVERREKKGSMSTVALRKDKHVKGSSMIETIYIILSL
jgi:hypothetical protein